MRKYKVIALSVGALGNKIFRAGDIVSESNFIPGRSEELVTRGFLEPIDAPKNIEEPVIDHAQNPLFNDVTAKELKEALTQRGVSFKSNATKQELFDLWIKE